MQKVGTVKGDQVRACCRSLEKLLRVYIDYQSQFKETQYIKQLEENAQKVLLIQQESEMPKRIIAVKDQEIAEKNKHIANTQIVTKELLFYKLFLERNETLYI